MFGDLSPGVKFKYRFDEVFIRVTWNLGVDHNGGSPVDFYRVYLYLN